MILSRIILIVLGIVVAVPVVFFIAALRSLSYSPAYDRTDPNYGHYAAAFRNLSELAHAAPASIDFTQLNEGNWKIACLFGGYTRPLEEMQALGANVNEKDRARLTEAGTRGFRLGQVEESEVLIAYIDLSNTAHFIHFQRGIGSRGQFLRKCISKPDTRLVIAN